MMCAWKELLAILPQSMRQQVDAHGKEALQELRLRLGMPPELVVSDRYFWLDRTVTAEELNYVVNAACRYSPWTAETAAKGYITAAGGHRIGLCGEAVCGREGVQGIGKVNSLCIRVARDFPGTAERANGFAGSVLILGAPGWGKTTLLRDLARQLARRETVAVVDERGELFPKGFTRGKRMDVLSNCPKTEGIDMVLRTMGPSCIAVDEITQKEDCGALIRAANCGVRLMATAHGVSARDLRSREIYRPLLEERIFDTLLILQEDKTYRAERMVS